MHASRRGFTLVELLVSIAIILALVGIAVLFINSGVFGNHRIKAGSDRVAGWLMQAKGRALRQNTPCGVRFYDEGGFIRRAEPIEVPDPYTMPAGNRLVIEHTPAGKRAYIVGPNAGEVSANVGNLDTLSIPPFGTIHLVSGIGPAPATVPGPAVEVLLYTSSKLPDLGASAGAVAGTPTYATTSFGFIRQARPVFGAEPLLVPEGIAIDSTNSRGLGGNAIAGQLDIVFSPNGEVQNPGGNGRYVLWVRNPEAGGDPRGPGADLRTTYEQRGEMSMITVYTKTGAVEVHPVALPADDDPMTPHDPYAYTKDGRATGL